MGYLIPPVSFKSSPKYPTNWTCSEKPQMEDAQEASKSDAHSTSTGSCRSPSGSFQMSELLSQCLRVTNGEKTVFGPLYLWYHFSGHYPELMTINEGWITDQLANQMLCLPAQLPSHHNNPVQCLHHYWHRSNSMNYWPLLATNNPGYLRCRPWMSQNNPKHVVCKTHWTCKPEPSSREAHRSWEAPGYGSLIPQTSEDRTQQSVKH